MTEVWIPSEKEFVKLKGNNQVKFQKGKVNDCCKQPVNLRLDHKDDMRKLTTWRCKVCNRNHYVMKAEPGVIGMTGKPIGR